MISVIIPTFNEEIALPKLITHLKQCDQFEGLEIIVSDGGSDDNTKDIAIENGMKFLKSPRKGRAAQMNVGAVKAKGEILYFLHADTLPPKNFIFEIEKSIGEDAEAGCFQLSFDLDHPVLKFYSWFTRFDVDLFRFGDQSLFVKKTLFEKVKGFDEGLIVMEDQMIVRKLKNASKFVILSQSAITSSRKYLDVGIVKLQLIFTVILAMFYLGVDQLKLVSYYKKWIR